MVCKENRIRREVCSNKLDKIDIKSMSLEELLVDIQDICSEKYRAGQIYKWLVDNKNFDEMTNLPVSLREKLKDKYFIYGVKIKDKKISSDGTVKYLFELYDKEFIESVVMKYNHGYSVCLSTQAGCKMGCVFCVTGKGGFCRNLFVSEMISQIQAIQDDLNIRVSNIVLMGMGEPLDNYDNVLKFIKLVSSGNNLNIGSRHISISTCGLVDKIYELAKEKLQVTLSVSLHAPNDNIRNKIMKINKRWDIKSLINACKYYIKNTGRRISFEYIMIKNLNDSIECAKELSKILKNMICHVNLIPMNNFDFGNNLNLDLKRSSNCDIYKFKNVLENENINVTVRRTLGKDINGACGQLKYVKNVENNILKNI